MLALRVLYETSVLSDEPYSETRYKYEPEQ
jgi:hypothetical protein